MTNAFTIPKQSTFTKDRARAFTRKMQTYHRNPFEITLPGSSKHPAPAMMTKPKEPKQ